MIFELKFHIIKSVIIEIIINIIVQLKLKIILKIKKLIRLIRFVVILIGQGDKLIKIIGLFILMN